MNTQGEKLSEAIDKRSKEVVQANMVLPKKTDYLYAKLLMMEGAELVLAQLEPKIRELQNATRGLGH